MKKKAKTSFLAFLLLPALLLGSCGTASDGGTTSGLPTGADPATASPDPAGTPTEAATDAPGTPNGPATGLTINGIDLADFTIVSDRPSTYKYPMQTLSEYLAYHHSVNVPFCVLGSQTTGHYIYVGTNKKEYGTFEAEILCSGGNVYLCAGSQSAGEQVVDTFIAKYLDGEKINVQIAEDQSVYHTAEPDWSQVPADYNVRDLILRSCKKIQEFLEFDHAQGLYYTYQNSGYKSTVKDARSSGNRTTNCVIVMNWVLKDAGLYSSGTLNHKYDGTCGYTFSGGVADAVSKYFEIIPVSGKSISQLAAEGNLQPGDVIFYQDHNQIIVDADRAMDAGRGNTEKVAVGSKFKCFLGPNPYLNSKPGYIFRPIRDVMLNDDNPYTPTARSFEDFGRVNVLRGATVKMAFNMSKISYAANCTDGQIYYDATNDTYSDFKMSYSAAEAKAPAAWYDANGEKSTVKDETHKYLCAVTIDSGKLSSVDGFAVFGQAYGESSKKYIGDVDGFDILVSEDGVNWTVVYSVENAACEGKYVPVTDTENFSAEGLSMTHYLRADFSGTVSARYFMYAVTEGRSKVSAKSGVTAYNVSTNQNYFRITEFMLFETEGFSE